MLLPVLLPTGFEPTKGVVVHSNPLDRVRNSIKQQRSQPNRSMELQRGVNNSSVSPNEATRSDVSSTAALLCASNSGTVEAGGDEIVFFDALEGGSQRPPVDGITDC